MRKNMENNSKNNSAFGHFSSSVGESSISKLVFNSEQNDLEQSTEINQNRIGAETFDNDNFSCIIFGPYYKSLISESKTEH